MDKSQANVILNKFKDAYNQYSQEIESNKFEIENIKKDFATKFSNGRYINSKIKARSFNRGITFASGAIFLICFCFAFIGAPIFLPIVFGIYFGINLFLEIKKNRVETMEQLLEQLNNNNESIHESFMKVKNLEKRNHKLKKDIAILEKKITVCQKYIFNSELPEDYDYSIIVKESKKAEQEIEDEWDDVYTFSL